MKNMNENTKAMLNLLFERYEVGLSSLDGESGRQWLGLHLSLPVSRLTAVGRLIGREIAAAEGLTEEEADYFATRYAASFVELHDIAFVTSREAEQEFQADRIPWITVTLSDEYLAVARELAAQPPQSLSAVVNDAVMAGLDLFLDEKRSEDLLREHDLREAARENGMTED